jgi:hypothetical protein
MSSTERTDVYEDIQRYIRIVAISSISDRAKKVINTYKKAEVYRALDGNTPDEKMHAMTKGPTRTVTFWVQEFVTHGLAAKVGRLEKALFTLEELGIDASSLKREGAKQDRGE